ncbi:MAG: hypothetical protein MZV63_62850 [Marinilabiliales bacterium]|nr:hypothetical protein [Marinilabiliales bacterium]
MRLATYRNRNIGFIFQEHLLLPHLTIRENIYLPFLAGGGRPDDDHIARLAERTGITGIMEKYSFQVSGERHSAPPSSGPWPTNPPCCWPTNLPAHSTGPTPAFWLFCSLS